MKLEKFEVGRFTFCVMCFSALNVAKKGAKNVNRGLARILGYV